MQLYPVRLIILCYCIGGFQLPLEDWKKILDDMNTKARKLEEDYEVTCTMRKVNSGYCHY